MKSNLQEFKAFVSSTYLDLKDHRAHVITSLRNAGFFVDPMENWTADSDEPKKFSQDRLAGCDLCILLIAFRRGYVPDDEIRSITQLEYDAAMAQGIDVLVLQLDDNAKWWAKYDEREKDATLEKWRCSLGKKHGVHFFTDDPRSIDMTGALGRWLTKKNGGRSEEEKIPRIDWPEDKSPYPGLEWFDENYAPLFFGRDREVQELVCKMSEPGGRFLVVSGPSGSGKSSLMAAGLWQALIEQGRLPGSQSWRWLRITPAADSRGPWASLAAALKQAFPKIAAQADHLALALERDPTAFQKLVTSHLASDQELVVFVDQLEELFTRTSALEEIQPFLSWLVTSCCNLQNRLRVVTTIRSEFFGRLAESEPLRLKINEGFNVLLGPLSPMALQEMINKPAAATGYALELGLLEMILNESGKEPGNLPLVAYALKQLFDRREGRTFTAGAYKAIGGVAGAIATKADEAMALLPEEVQGAFNAVFADLVHVERERPPTRRRAYLSSFGVDQTAVQLIQVLAGEDCRVLVTSRSGQETIVEVAHEKLFSAWKRLKDWIDNSDRDLRLIDFEEECAARWHEKDCRVQSLWSHEQAIAIQRALARFKKAPSPRLHAFLHPQQILIERLKNEAVSHPERLLIGQKLAEFGDPRAGVGLRPDGLPDILWIDIPGGQVRLEEVDHVFEIKPFRIAKYPVTNMQFGMFINADDGYGNEQWWNGIEQIAQAAKSAWDEANAPRETVSWYEAVAFFRWLGYRTRSKIRLPTEWEWQSAAAGSVSLHTYPWGDNWDSNRCNSSESGLKRTTPVGMYPHGATDPGVLDMSGNVWEWCLNTYEHPELPESICVDSRAERVLRGGSWSNSSWSLRTSFRRRDFTYIHQGEVIGFRLAQDIEP